MLIVFLMVAVGSAFAADDVANETVSLDEQDELIEIENDDSALEEVDESLGSEEAQENLQASNTVTNDTFFNYFDEYGRLKDDVTSDELVFEGEFSNIADVSIIYINKPITLTGKDAVIKNIEIYIDSSNVVLNNFRIDSVAHEAIAINDAHNVKIINNNITFLNDEFDSVSLISATFSNHLTFQSNRVTVISSRILNKFIDIRDSDYVVIDNNDFTGTMRSTGYQNGAISLNDATFHAVFSNNNVNLLSGPKGTDTTTIAVAFAGKNVTLSGNDIGVTGDTYTYAVCALGSDSKIVNNKINASSPNYACGVNLEGSNVTLVDNNRISAASDVSSYGIYSGMTNGGLTGVYSNNNIDVSGYFAVGVSMSSFDESVIDNTIVVAGNYTIGVGAGYCNAYDASWNPIQVPIKNRIVKGNTINSLGNNIGADDNGDYLFDYRSTGIKDVAGNLTVLDNTINSTNIGISASGADDIIIQFNKVYVNTTLINSKLVYLIDSIGAFIDNNTFVAVVPSSGYQMGVLHFNEGSNDLVFSNNNVVVSAVEMSSSMNAVVFAGKNVTLTGNIVSVGDDKYSYAICALGSDSKIVDNTIMASSPVYACGVNLEGSNVTLVDNNRISVLSSLSEGASYGIYSGMTSGGLTGVYSNNNIEALGYFVVGVSMSSFDESVIDNTIVVAGNYTIGVGAGYCNAYDASWNPIQVPIKNRIVKGNTINSLGTNVGTNSSGDYLFDYQSTGIKDVAGNLTILDNTIISTNIGISASGSDDIIIQFNKVYINTTLINSKLVYLIDSIGAFIDNNTFVAVVPSSGYQMGVLHFNDDSNDLVFSNNNVVVSAVEMSSSMNAVVFAGKNVTLTGNIIAVGDDKYSYAICALGSDSKIVDNTIVASSPVYACGVNLEGSNVTLVDNNKIFAVSSVSEGASYGIYSGMTNGGLTGVYSNNTIEALGYFVVGVSMSSFDESVIDNTIVVEGNYTIGVGAGYCNAYDASWNPIEIPIKNRIVKGNTINSLGTNVGTNKSGDYLFDYQSTGIKDVAGNITIINNNIQSTGVYAIVLANKNATVTNNSLLAARTSGDFSIANKDNAVISGSSPEYKTILFASDLTKTEGSADQYVVTAMDENGNVIVNKTISISVNGATQNATTDEKGVAKFNIDLAAGTYAVKASFAGDKIYGQKSISNTITVNAKPAPNPPSPPSPPSTPSTPSTNKVTKKSVKITAKKKTFKAKTKTKKYTIIVKAGKKAVKGLKVTLKVKGKTYKATTNAKGKATFKIKNLKKKGKYTAKIKFAGNKLYNKAAKSVKITVKK